MERSTKVAILLVVFISLIAVVVVLNTPHQREIRQFERSVKDVYKMLDDYNFLVFVEAHPEIYIYVLEKIFTQMAEGNFSLDETEVTEEELDYLWRIYQILTHTDVPLDEEPSIKNIQHTQETEQDEIYQQSIYFGLAFYATLFPDEASLDENGNGFYRINFWFGQYVIDYKLMFENSHYYGTMIIIQDCVYTDFFDGLQVEDYGPEESGSEIIPTEKFRIHQEHFYSLAKRVSGKFPNVSKLIWALEQINSVNDEIGTLEEGDEAIDDLETAWDYLDKMIEDLVEEIRSENLIIEENGVEWLILPELQENGDVKFSIIEQPKGQNI